MQGASASPTWEKREGKHHTADSLREQDRGELYVTMLLSGELNSKSHLHLNSSALWEARVLTFVLSTFSAAMVTLFEQPFQAAARVGDKQRGARRAKKWGQKWRVFSFSTKAGGVFQ